MSAPQLPSSTLIYAGPDGKLYVVEANDEIVLGAGAIPEGALVKKTNANDTYALLLHTDAAGLAVGVATGTCTEAGAPFPCRFVTGTIVEMLSDGSGVINPGDYLVTSATIDGRVASGSAASPSRVGLCDGDQVPATMDAPVVARFVAAAGGGGGSGNLPAFLAQGDGFALFQRGNGGAAVAEWNQITQDDIAPGFAIQVGFTGTGAVEAGTSIASVSVSISYPSGTPDTVTLSDGTTTVNLASPYTSGTISGPYVMNGLGTRTFTVTATKSGVVRTATAQIAWQFRHYWGLAPTGTLNSAFANALASSGIGPSAAGSYAFSSSDGAHYLWLVVPTADPQPTSFTSGGFVFPMTLAASNVGVTNPHSIDVLCNFYQSNPIVLAGTMVAS